MYEFTLEQIKEVEKRQLTNDEMMVLKLRVSIGTEDIGHLLGISRQRVSAIEGSARRKAGL